MFEKDSQLEAARQNNRCLATQLHVQPIATLLYSAMEARLFLADGRTDRHYEAVAFRNFANAAKIQCSWFPDRESIYVSHEQESEALWLEPARAVIIS